MDWFVQRFLPDRAFLQLGPVSGPRLFGCRVRKSWEPDGREGPFVLRTMVGMCAVPERRNSMKRYSIWLAVAALVTMLLPGSTATADEKKNLTFAAIATEEMAVVAERWQPAIKYIEEKAGVKVNFFATTSYAAAVEAMLNNFADFGMLGPKIYTVARAKSDKIEPIVGTGRPPNHFLKEPCACYHGRLITKKGGKFETIESLKGRRWH